MNRPGRAMKTSEIDRYKHHFTMLMYQMDDLKEDAQMFAKSSSHQMKAVALLGLGREYSLKMYNVALILDRFAPEWEPPEE